MATKLVSVSIDSIRIGEPLPFGLMDAEGTLLAAKGYVIASRGELQSLVGRGVSLYIDVADSEAHHRAYVGLLHDLVRKEKTLGQIAGTHISRAELDTGRGEPDQDDGPPDWLDYQVQANSILRDSGTPQFLPRLVRLQKQLRRHSMRNADGALFALFHLSASELRMYSATHAMLVSVMCGLAAREVLNWPAEQEHVLCLAALTMNLGMTELQDKLAQQLSPLTPEQRQLIDQHAPRSVALLQKLGVNDTAWLEAVRHHHSVPPGPLAAKTEGLRMARLIQRADMFGARLSPRASRIPTAPAAAMQASYFDENRQVDEAGAALIKAVGIYSPGSFVRLNTDEVAVVIRRGANTTTPRVAVLINREGIPMAEPVIRDTSMRDHRIVASVPHREVKVQLNLQRMLALTTGTGSDRA
jgi:HD-GYP domain-containing protein (c-di-GMP phosphodiesterase class II)